MLVNGSELAAIASNAAFELASRQYNKLLGQTSGQYKALDVRPHTVAIEKTVY